MPWRVKGKFLWIGEVGGFGKISFIALFYLYVNSGRRGILRALRRGLTRHAGAMKQIVVFRAHALSGFVVSICSSRVVRGVILRALRRGLCAFVEAACATGGILSARTEQTSVSIVKF